MPEPRSISVFYLRLALYLTVYLIPVFHPAIVVSYDSDTVWLWFLFVPLQLHIAFFAPPRFGVRNTVIVSAVIVIASVIIVSGFDRLALLFASVQISAYVLTYALFNLRALGKYAGIAELALVSVLYVRLTGFSRASETFARASGAVTQAILAISLGAIVLHALLVYLTVHGEGIRRRTLRELGMFATAAAVLGFIVAFAIPPDFVNHNVVLNQLGDPPDPEIQPLDEEGNGLDGGNLRSDQNPEDQTDGAGSSEGQNRADGSGDASGQTARLEGIRAEEWGNRTDQPRGSSGSGRSEGEGEGQSSGEGDGEGESKQYAVMVVGSEYDPIYAADGYFETLDPERGFLYTPNIPLNNLTYSRLLETWANPEPVLDPMRNETDVFFLSTIPERVIPYAPVTIEPTVLNTRYHPFDFAYAVTSGISRSTPRQWRQIEPLTLSEREQYAPYLEVELAEPYGSQIEALASSLFADRSGYLERLDAILAHFTTFQYEIGFTDDVAVPAISRFLFETRNGDCTEFSNAAAILARIAGIPSRVVTGYLATQDLQTPRHRQGLAILQQNIEPLAEFPIDQLLLVTTAHRHSWVQVLMPGFGWIDLETTATAIPPVGSMDPNAMDVVIPIITAEELDQPGFVFPWLLVGQTLLVLLVTVLAAAYMFRYGRRLYLNRMARGDSKRALSALYTLLLSHLATEGYPLKPESDTSVEYAERHPELATFAERYSHLRYGPGATADERWESLRESYRDTLRNTRRRGVVALVKRVFSLRELRY